ncbi:MAG TPA: ATP-grasp fold amidoligase family protein [Lutibacter sp.]
MNNFIKKITNPHVLLLFIVNKTGLSNLMSDKLYVKLLFRRVMGKKLNLENPQTFNEKLNWLKLYDRKSEYSKMVDKYDAKKYVADIIGEEYIIPTYGIWDKFDDIDFDKLPNQFVLKCTHDSGSVIICRDKNKFDLKYARNKIGKALKTNLYFSGREYPYKYLKPRIIAEELLLNYNDQGALSDYKFVCFDGRVHSVMVCTDREVSYPKFYFFNKKWELLRLHFGGLKTSANFTLPKPINVELMFEIAAKLSKNIPFLRVDLYSVNNNIYFGELTFYPSSGFDSSLLPETESLFGSKIEI